MVQKAEAAAPPPRSSTLSPSPNGSAYTTASENNPLNNSDGMLSVPEAAVVGQQQPQQRPVAMGALSQEEQTLQLQKQLLQLQQQQQLQMQAKAGSTPQVQPQAEAHPQKEVPAAAVAPPANAEQVLQHLGPHQPQQHSLPPNAAAYGAAAAGASPSPAVAQQADQQQQIRQLSEQLQNHQSAASMQQQGNNLSPMQQQALQQQQSSTHSLPPVPSRTEAASQQLATLSQIEAEKQEVRCHAAVRVFMSA